MHLPANHQGSLLLAMLWLMVGCQLPTRLEPPQEGERVSCASTECPEPASGGCQPPGNTDQEHALTHPHGQGADAPKSPRMPREVFRQDTKDYLPMLKRDARQLATWENAAILGVALGGAMAVRQELDDEVRLAVDRHPDRWDEGSRLLGSLGDPQYQIPLLLGTYAYSLHTEDEELHSLSRALISAYTLTGISTVAIKGAANTERPSREWNDGQFGFPSFHVASSFSIAAVLDERYGLKAAVPAYAVSGLIGWSRIDERDHDLSDVVFGAALGYVIGKSVARHHLRDSSSHWVPYAHPIEPAAGIGWEWEF